MRGRVRKGFTLVEILIVVVILGILAAIVVPQFTSATEDAQRGNVITQLQTINNQLELFRARYNADPEFDTQGWTLLIDGGTLASGREVEGGFMRAPPRHPRFPDRAQAEAIVAGSAPLANGQPGGSDVAGWYFYTDSNGYVWVGASMFNELTGEWEDNQ